MGYGEGRWNGEQVGMENKGEWRREDNGEGRWNGEEDGMEKEGRMEKDGGMEK